MSTPFSLRLLLGLSLAFTSLYGQTHHIVGMAGARNVFRGSTIYVMLDHHWYDFTPIAPIQGSSRILAPGHKFTENSKVRIHSLGGSAPSIINPFRTYEVCDVEPNAFQVVPDSSSNCKESYLRVQFTDSGSGAVKAGRDLGMHKSVYLSDNIEGVPPGVTVEAYCGNSPCPRSPKYPTYYYSYRGNSNFKFVIRASKAAPLGKVTLRLSLRIDDEAPIPPVEFTFNIREHQPAAEARTFVASTPQHPPPIPNLAKWETTMKTLAAKWCPPGLPVPTMSYGVESQVWYYDGAKVYFDIAEYTKDIRWKDCSAGLAKQYRAYVMKSNGAIPAWRAFAHGLRRTEALIGDPDGLALSALALNGKWRSQISVLTTEIRETAYYLMTVAEYERRTGIRLDALQRNADLLMGMFDQLFVSRTGASHQIWMDGLAARALIEYHSLTKDPRALTFVKLAADWIWSNGRVPGSAGLMTNAEPLGPDCDWGCQKPSTDLVQLVAPMFAWLYWQTGESVYQERGDVLFSEAVNTNISYSGKIFSQNYTWSVDYVRWRSLPPGSRVEP